MATEAERLTQPLTQGAEDNGDFAPSTSTDFKKVEAGSELREEAAPIGSRPLSVSQSDIPHHPGADPKVPDQRAEEQA